MARMKDAEARLERAIKRLEAATRRPLPAATPSEVERELAAARAQCERLDNRTREVSGRLDRAIARLQTILGNADGAG